MRKILFFHDVNYVSFMLLIAHPFRERDLSRVVQQLYKKNSFLIDFELELDTAALCACFLMLAGLQVHFHVSVSC